MINSSSSHKYMARVLVIDNIDSFVYNLVQYVGVLGAEPVVLQNTAKMAEIRNLIKKDSISRIIISPGPKSPKDAGISNAIIKEFGSKIPILGVCLGHQCIGYSFGAEIRKARKARHGKTSLIRHAGKGVFRGISNPFKAARYHSLVVEEKNLPPCLEVTARSLDDGEIMGLKHRECEIYGLQFHPESIMTKEEGMKIIGNFLSIKGR